MSKSAIGTCRALALVAALAASPLAAQSNTSTAAPPSSNIGPGELSNFSLNGTVTRPADQAPAVQPAPAARREPAASVPVADRPVAAVPSTRRPAKNPASTSQSDLFRRPPTLSNATAANAVSVDQAQPLAGGTTAIPAPDPEDFSLLPWIVAVLAVAGMAVMYVAFRRREQRVQANAGPSPIDIIRRGAPGGAPDAAPDAGAAPSPAPMPASTPRPDPVSAGGNSARRPLPTTLMPPQPAPPAPPSAQPVMTPKPLADAPPGVVISTSLRPWIDIDLIPDRALLDDQGAAIAFDVILFNSGSAAARDVIVEARLLNAGASQDRELGEFFAAAETAGDPIPLIAPYARIPLRSAVRLARADIRDYDIDGRKLFVPLVAVSVRYRWSSGAGHSAAGFLVGQGAEEQEKLAPLRLDKGDRSWNGLCVRRYEKGLRS